MRKQLTLGIFLAGIAALWMVAAPTQWRIFPLIDTGGAASGWWALRQQVLHLSGLWSVGLMTLCMVLALRQPWMERPFGGLDQVYRLHKWAGMAAGVMAMVHWGAKESGAWIRNGWGTAGRPERIDMASWAEPLRSTAKDVGEIAFYMLLALLVLTLCQQLLSYRKWRWTHRVMPLIYLALVFHSMVLMPAPIWAQPVGVIQALFFAAGSIAAVMALSGRIGASRSYRARVERVNKLAGPVDQSPLELLCTMPRSWPGHAPGQFVFVTVEGLEGAHPFTIASAPGVPAPPGPDRGGEQLRFLIKPLGDFTAGLPTRLRPGMDLRIEGPYGCFDGEGSPARQQVWVAAGVGITPFLAMLKSRQHPLADAPALMQEPVHMHYCTRDAATDAVLPQVRMLCAGALPPVQLTVHDASSGERFEPREHLGRFAARPIDIWLCGPAGLGKALAQACRKLGSRQWHLHRELFAMR